MTYSTALRAVPASPAGCAVDPWAEGTAFVLQTLFAPHLADGDGLSIHVRTSFLGLEDDCFFPVTRDGIAQAAEHIDATPGCSVGVLPVVRSGDGTLHRPIARVLPAVGRRGLSSDEPPDPKCLLRVFAAGSVWRFWQLQHPIVLDAAGLRLFHAVSLLMSRRVSKVRREDVCASAQSLLPLPCAVRSGFLPGPPVDPSQLINNERWFGAEVMRGRLSVDEAALLAELRGGARWE